MSDPAPSKIRHFTERGLSLAGIIHVGMNDGEEIPDYLHLGLKPVLGFEPQPTAFARAWDLFGGDERVTMDQIALSDESGTLTLNIPGHLHDTDIDDSKGASFLLPNRQTGYDWNQRYRVVRTVEVPVWRFDEWADANLPPTVFPYNTLVVDVEGLELKVLRGFGDYLAEFDYLSVECSQPAIFEGQDDARAVLSFLEGRGFEQDSPIEEPWHNDVFFVRRGVR